MFSTRGIMSFIALLAVAVHVSPQARAQTEIALYEMRNIANAMDVCAMDTLYYVASETLNDSPYATTPPTIDYINYEGGTYVIQPSQGRFKTGGRADLLAAYNQWRGPYLNYQPGRTQTGLTPYDQGSPIDPWGNPYYFFSPFGLLRGGTGSVTLDLYGDWFDRYTLVSLGPDGAMSGDDLFYQFGYPVTAFGISSLRYATACGEGGACGPAARPDAPAGTEPVFVLSPGAVVLLRGMNLGSTQGGATVWFGAEQLTQISGWSERQVMIDLPAGLTGAGELFIKRGGAQTNSLQVMISGSVTAAGGWTLYQ
ncbi:MAG: hypothetical protein NTY46_05905 [Candidatus Sumerlaeota bacterium]|nr:hypothetical protein [Candidatus Sumerlaeota bacterium]